MRDPRYFTYILTNAYHTVLYTGVTNDLIRRVTEHKNGTGSKFTSHYRVCKLVYYEVTESAESAIGREKQIKGWSRAKKVSLIESANPEWKDLSDEL
ncbi:MAG: GIY-YIG nuclease family protein [Chloroflexota bacterium]|nr:MAG: nuclease [Bellilinea sp.]